MNKVRHLCLAALLTFTLAPSASAGEIECGVPSPPPPTAGTNEAGGEAGGGAVDVIVTLLQSVLSVL